MASKMTDEETFLFLKNRILADLRFVENTLAGLEKPTSDLLSTLLSVIRNVENMFRDVINLVKEMEKRERRGT
ncbi:MAG: hypothetical protein ACTSXX_10540 [Candidatus Baldrarchaeia archaeon]